jgi:hypothetical protein
MLSLTHTHSLSLTHLFAVIRVGLKHDSSGATSGWITVASLVIGVCIIRGHGGIIWLLLGAVQHMMMSKYILEREARGNGYIVRERVIILWEFLCFRSSLFFTTSSNIIC